MKRRYELQHDRDSRLIAWTPPMVGWVKLNTDGASHGNPALATATGGGDLRDNTFRRNKT